MMLHTDGFASVFVQHKFEITRRLQDIGHLFVISALSKVNVGVAIADISDADIILTEPVIISIVDTVLGSRPGLPTDPKDWGTFC
ncbi:unnamed protein product [Rotaria magnacalcarata]|uniref:Uncharacterized protein n=1 Tax=Rotaria magnacalcarata TaxID=392030 RepID=A0A820BAG9_9BILA|nr:unnamed protein product [Rotaria magnacalcarata]CAF4098291.1 unnamed protein product [Rotaria magnacalcarata]CAF4189452.1 unnamed protein product [Rotaria magnacalcarata]